jgi:kumamolisin
MADEHIVLKGSRRFHRGGVEILGHADSHEWCEVTVKLRRKSPIPEPSKSGSPVLTKKALLSSHGADPKDVKKVEDVFKRYGLTVVERNDPAASIRFGGSAEDMERAFAVHLFKARHEGRTYRARTGDIHIPKELDGIVIGVFGLDNRRMTRHRRQGSKKSITNSASGKSRPWFFSGELASFYKFPANDGAGQTVGIIELDGEFLPDDLKKFGEIAGLRKLPKVDVINVETIDPRSQGFQDACVEVMLDVETIAGACPGSNIVMYFSNFTEQGWVEAIDSAVHDSAHELASISVSFGLAEGADVWTEQAMELVNDSLKTAAALGIPVCIAAGDDGSDDQVGDGRAHVDFPASSPFVLAVGGTTLIRNAGGHTEVTWKEGDGLRKDGGGSTGGGVSTVFPRPDWQTVDIISVNPRAPKGRCIPDVSADAAESSGYRMVVFGKTITEGGTSAAAPLWAAFIARLGAAGKKVGYLTPRLYQANPKTSGQPLGKVCCNDITKGNNTTAAAGGYSAGEGYDAATGWGSPNGESFLEFLS